MLLEPNRVVINDDCLIIDSDFGIIPVRGPSVIALARKVLPLLDGRDIQTLLMSFEESEAGDVELLLEFFGRAGVLRSKNSACDALRPLITVAGGPEARLRLADTAVGVVCGSNWADDVIAELASANVRVMIVNREDECDLLDLLVVVADSSDTETHRRSARWAWHRNIAVLHGTRSPTEIVVGPLFRPGLGACWNCAQFRSIANQPHAVAAHSLDENRTALTVPSHRHSGLFGKIAASVLTLEAFKAVLLKADTLLSRLWVFNPLSLTSSSHLVVPLPSCNVCGGARGVDRRSLFSLNLDAVQNATSLDTAFPGWIDPRTGVITAAWFENEDLDDGPYFVSAQLSSYSNSKFSPVPGDPCGGKGINRVDAIRSGIGEALERYSAGRLDKDRIHYVHATQLSGDILSPTAIGLYTSRQYDTVGFPFLPFDPQQEYHWIEGVWLPSRKPVWVPAESTFFLANSLGDQLCQTTTSGLALGSDIAVASARALLELVERDATMMTWLCHLPGHSIILDQCDDTLNAILHGLQSLDVNVEFYLLDVGVSIPTVLACGFGDGNRWPGLCVGSAAHSSARIALRAAALEMVYTAQGLLRTGAQLVEQPEAIRSNRFIDHALYYLLPERADAAAFLRGGSNIKYSLLPEISESEAVQLGAMLADIGIRVAIVDVTSPDVALSGLRVVRALADGLLPIHCGHGFARCGSRRLRDRLTAINPDPHPFC
jgi:ribosomal protein S12 methylthiotransferase accessory factor